MAVSDSRFQRMLRALGMVVPSKDVSARWSVAAFFCGVRYYFFLPLLPHSLNFHCKHSVTGAPNPVLGGAYGLVAGGDYQPWERFSFQGLVGHRSDSQTSQASGRVPDNSVRGWGLIAWLRELPAMGAVLRLGASWLQWRHPDIPSTRLSHSVTVAWANWFGVGTNGCVAGITSHGSSSLSRAGWLQWRPSDIPGTHLPYVVMQLLKPVFI